MGIHPPAYYLAADYLAISGQPYYGECFKGLQGCWEVWVRFRLIERSCIVKYPKGAGLHLIGPKAGPWRSPNLLKRATESESHPDPGLHPHPMWLQAGREKK